MVCSTRASSRLHSGEQGAGLLHGFREVISSHEQVLHNATVIASAAELLHWEEEPPKLGCGPVCALLLMEHKAFCPLSFKMLTAPSCSPRIIHTFMPVSAALGLC